MHLALSPEDLRPLIDEIVNRLRDEFKPQQTAPQPLLLNADQAAELLGVCARTVSNMAAEGAFPIVRIGRAVRFSRASLEQWITANSETSTVTS